MASRGFRFSIDRGGTFTDIYAEVPDEKGFRVLKLLSEDPANYPDAPREGIRRILEEVTGNPYPQEKPIDTSQVDWIRMGTTVATNALLERKGERCALIITQGFRDLLQIGNQSRPDIFDIKVRRPELLYEDVVEVDERVVLDRENEALPSESSKVVVGTTGDRVAVIKEVDPAKVKEDLQRLFDKGIRSIAVAFLHSYAFDAHEKLVGQLATEIGFTQVSLSSELMPMVRIVPRGLTACVDAYLTPGVHKYVQGFKSGFDKGLEEEVKVSFMQSDGGLTPADNFCGFRAILSGPAGGVVGYAMTTYNEETKEPVIGFDMGGTSTDVSRYAGTYEQVHETETAGVTVQAPQLDVNTVAAGGGSRLFFEAGMFVVGPESVGAHPGPVCYHKGGNLAVTDANLVLGRLIPEYFPKIFGPSQKEPLDKAGSEKAFDELSMEINSFLRGQASPELTRDEIAYGFLTVANEAMCRPIRELSEARGHDTSSHILACFGGAGGQHACAIARSLKMKKIFVHRFSGILSAYGMGLADIVVDKQEPYSGPYSPENKPDITQRLNALAEAGRQELRTQGFKDSAIECEEFLNLRYEGADCALMTMCPHDQDYVKAFEERYKREYGFTLDGRSVLVDDIRVRAIGKNPSITEKEYPLETGTASPVGTVSTYFEGGRRETNIYLLEDLRPGYEVDGPCIIMNNTSTILVEPDCRACITKKGDVEIVIGAAEEHQIGTNLDPVQLSVFSHRFMSIAEQMGRALQRTSVSTNIKERLDFSCALFGPDGGLVANAPHVPVHLGAMQETVRWQMNHWLGGEQPRGMKDGDVFVTNHPSAGGSHLPDITVVTPFFDAQTGKPLFFVASRGHHGDIGGITPGSMPPFSRKLVEEGAAIKTFKLVSEGKFDQEGITKLLMEPGSWDSEPGAPKISGTRNLADNISDLQAQVAANKKGVELLHELIAGYGRDVVIAYMGHVQTSAELAVKDMLTKISLTRGLPEVGTLVSEDAMDDGTPIKLSLTIDRNSKEAKFDFEGTGPEVYGNWNAPKAVTSSAIIYCLRSLVEKDIPMNSGCMQPITLNIPEGSILSPSDDSAVVGGNVLTSQRVVDVVLRAFGRCASSQGCMNNLTFGDDSMGYYETIGGGAGAGDGWDGTSGVQCHMTNTRITDPEILERRYPVLLTEFSINAESGGDGQYVGGDGLIREMQFRKNMVVSILSERRVLAPPGYKGGCDGRKGRNLLLRGCKVLNLGGKNSVKVTPLEKLRVETPGGGGYGSPVKLRDDEANHSARKHQDPTAPPTRGNLRTIMTAGEY